MPKMKPCGICVHNIDTSLCCPTADMTTHPGGGVTNDVEDTSNCRLATR